MNILITGASKGIGYQLVKLFARDKANKIIAIARSKDLLQELENKSETNNIVGIYFDLEEIEKIKSDLIPQIYKHVNSVDILINNAGFLINKPFDTFNLQEIQKLFDINLISPAVLTRELLHLIKESSIKHVVNISSMGGFQGSSKFPGLSFYSSSKAALANLTECLAEEYKNDDIKFNCLALGAVNTEMLQTAFPDYTASINPPEMAQFIYDFAMIGHKYFNGKIIPVSNTTP